MTHRNCNLLLVLLLAFASVAAYIPSANGATALFIPSAAARPTTKDRKRRYKDVASAAKSMNSVAFLSELVALKDTSDVSYFRESNHHEPAIATVSRGGGGSIACRKRKDRKHSLRRVLARAVRSGTVQLSAAVGHDDIEKDGNKVHCTKSHDATIAAVSNAFSESTTTEYTGNLWFMRSKGIRFRETVRVSEISSDGKTAIVECTTKYRTNGRWHDCSKVVCTLTAVDQGINMATDSEVLVSLPLPGLAGKAVRTKISAAFESAAQAFFNVEGNVVEAGNTQADDSSAVEKPTTGLLFYAY